MDRTELFKLGLVPSSDFLNGFVATYNNANQVVPGFEHEHPEDIAANATTALEWYAHGWTAALEYIMENA